MTRAKACSNDLLWQTPEPTSDCSNSESLPKNTINRIKTQLATLSVKFSLNVPRRLPFRSNIFH